jgi:hypothetical protein
VHHHSARIRNAFASRLSFGLIDILACQAARSLIGRGHRARALGTGLGRWRLVGLRADSSAAAPSRLILSRPPSGMLVGSLGK